MLIIHKAVRAARRRRFLAGTALLAAVSVAGALSLGEGVPLTPDEQVELWVGQIVLQQFGTPIEPGRPECRIAKDVAIMFAPGVSESFKQRIMRRAGGGTGGPGVYFQIRTRWTRTATNPSTGGLGNPITITYSFVPDGTFIPNVGLGQGPSNLQARLTAQFGGNAALWRQKFAEAFGRWGQVTGITFFEENDDGAPLHGSSGFLGVRGDVRISGFGYTTGILAYNFFPNNGDMVLNTNINWGNSGANWRLLRNTVMHEHGHGFGLNHVDPVNGTKLMERFLNTNFDGPQDDDIQGGQRLYGDPKENNDSNGSSYNLGTVTNGMAVEFLSTDDDFDRDWYRVIVPAGKVLAITAAPVGRIYLQGPVGGQTTWRNSKAINDLQIRAYNNNGTVLLGFANDTGRGVNEVLLNVVPPPDNIVKVNIDDATPLANDIQRYRLIFNLSPLTESFVPESFTIIRGLLLSGGLPDLFFSDDSRLVVRTAVFAPSIEPPVQIEVVGT
ncbi:MAG: matrixin family metalloprotease, partial [Armatimonadetes bacterium]|nr:matrixin family metalloprotease [Armatimonadota bacterium]